MRMARLYEGGEMSYFREKANDIEYFIEGISSVCNDKNIIARKTKERFGDNYSKLIDYLLFLETEQINAKTLATALNNRDLEDGFYRFESKCAKKNNLVIVTGYSDALEAIPWSYQTNILHESFYATFRGEPCCEGFVFSVEDLQKNN